MEWTLRDGLYQLFDSKTREDIHWDEYRFHSSYITFKGWQCDDAE